MAYNYYKECKNDIMDYLKYEKSIGTPAIDDSFLGLCIDTILGWYNFQEPKFYKQCIQGNEKLALDVLKFFEPAKINDHTIDNCIRQYIIGANWLVWSAEVKNNVLL